jgi:hypothetical protein
MLQIQKIQKFAILGLAVGIFCMSSVCPQVIIPAGEIAEKASSDTVKTQSTRKARFKKMIKKIAAAGGITVAAAGILAVAYVTYIQVKTKEKIRFAQTLGLLEPYITMARIV